MHLGNLLAASKCEGPYGGKEGLCAPDFTLKTLDGNEVRLSSFLGKVIFLNFWATWCTPCAIEIPEMEKAYRKLRSHSFAMLAISIDTEGKAAIDKFFKETFKGEISSFPILLDPEKKISHQYGTFKVPETYIIDKRGRIRDKVEGIREWNDSLIRHYLELLIKEP